MLTVPLYGSEKTRRIDQLANKAGQSNLMQQAGKQAFDFFKATYSQASTLYIICGKGNNGGDGFVFALHALKAGLQVQICCPFSMATLTADAQKAVENLIPLLEKNGQFIHNHLLTDWLSQCDCVIDALLGTGVSGKVKAPLEQLIQTINQSLKPVFSIDCPSGLNCDTGEVLGLAIKATHTLTFITRKPGLFTCDAKDFCGQVAFAPLGVSPTLYSHISSEAELLVSPPATPKRAQNTHKYNYGPALIIAGDENMPGAAQLSSQSAVLTGCGIVNLFTLQTHQSIHIRLPEVVFLNTQTLKDAYSKAKVILIGPGITTTISPLLSAFKSLNSQIDLEAPPCKRLPLILDAGALNDNEWLLELKTHFELILTPHSGEAARLLNCTPQSVEKDRLYAAKKIAQTYQALTVLKGSGTIIATPTGKIFICPYGNSALASAGMGDVLGGLIASLIAQNQSILNAVISAVMWHAQAADHYVQEQGPFGLTASQLIYEILKRMNGK